MLKLSEKGYQKYDVEFLITEHVNLARKLIGLDLVNNQSTIVEQIILNDGNLTTASSEIGGFKDGHSNGNSLCLDYYENVKITIKYTHKGDRYPFAEYTEDLVYKRTAIHGADLVAHRQCIEFKEKIMNGKEKRFGCYSESVDVDAVLIKHMVTQLDEHDTTITPMTMIRVYIDTFNPNIQQEGCILKLPLVRKLWTLYLQLGGLKSHTDSIKWTVKPFREIEKSRDYLSAPLFRSHREGSNNLPHEVHAQIRTSINNPTLLFLVDRLTLECLVPVLQLHLDSPSEIVDSLPLTRRLVNVELVIPTAYINTDIYHNNEFLNVLSTKLNEHLIKIMKKMENV